MSRKLRYSIIAADLLWMALAFILVHWLPVGPPMGGSGIAGLLYACAFPIWIGLYFTKKLEGFRGGWHLPNICAQVTVGVLYMVVALFAVALFTHAAYSMPALLSLMCLWAVGFISIRCGTWWLAASRSRLRGRRRVVILGRGRVASELALKIARHPELSMEVTGILSPSDIKTSHQVPAMPLGSISLRTLNALTLMQEQEVKELIVVEPLPQRAEISKLISNCRKAGMEVHLVPERYELYLSKAKLTEIDDVPLLSLKEQALPILGMEMKRVMDLLGASLLLSLTAPILSLAVAALYVNRKRALRKELRCGRNGRLFWMHRLDIDRDASDLSAGERILAQFSFTELPQLWNILKGEMSLVGPRPEPPARVKHYSMWQRQRLTVTPGLTGLAQVRGLREQHSSEEKACFDLQYLLDWSLFLDISLLLQTIWILFVRLGRQGALAKPGFQPSSDLPLRAVVNANSTQSGAD
ncbi:MAG TPA: sugar transferase [Candidatus Saccharimonadales bacterium]|jgi:lipopolysaccharide/colanic/teichoic acid biosynthesis glycosyltransferase|nr:sugar transferase [Candidatus Saccharimonadales bacterium]